MSKSTPPEIAPLSPEELQNLRSAANIVRGLAMDGVQKANSGHPGLPLGMADVATVLWNRFLRHNPQNPRWPDRDRFVLSAGHGSMLLYSLLYLCGYDLPLSELQNFRQWQSKTPGHPEFGLTPGVETTTGPLGQGISNAVGMALAEKKLAAHFNRPGLSLVDHNTYVIASDGDLMEGVSHESCALAAHLGLGKLIVLYDDNHISIDGPTELSFSEDVLKRFSAYGWNTARIDGHDPQAIFQAISAARAQQKQPSIIACRTIIGYGSPNRANTAKAHGEPLGTEEVRLTKEALGLPADREFFCPEELLNFWRKALSRGDQQETAWKELSQRYAREFPGEWAEFQRLMSGTLPQRWEEALPSFAAGKSLATRAASGETLNALTPLLPELIGGSADLTPSNNTRPAGEKEIRRDDFSGRYLHFGVREHGMAAILNGMALHGGLIPYGGTFLVFSDYMRPSIRLAALMGIRVIFVFTHDSIGLGEDGPTHQPVEHLAALRAIPNLWVMRPGDAAETAQAWRCALQRHDGPTALALTRQKLPVLDRQSGGMAAAQLTERGAYVLVEDADFRVILMASGSEVHIALAARRLLNEQRIGVRVVSVPCLELFRNQPADYQRRVLPPEITARVAIEAAVPLSWPEWVGQRGEIIGLNHFGASAPYEEIYRGFGITAEAVAAAAQRVMAAKLD